MIRIEFVNTLSEVAVKLAEIKPDVTVAGPALNGGWGLTTEHDGYKVHLGIGQLHKRRESTSYVADGKLYLNLKALNNGRPLVDLLKAGLRDNFALSSLSDGHVLSKDPSGQDQFEWEVDIFVPERGLSEQSLAQDTFFITSKQPWRAINSLVA